MDQAHFDACIKHLEICVNGKGTGPFYTLLFEKFAKLDNKRYSEACKWLSENYSGYGKNFPNIPDFNEALKNTKKDTYSNYKPSPKPSGSEQEQVRAIARELASKFVVVDNNKKDHVKMLRTKYKNNLIYSLKLGYWVDRSLEGNVGGHFIYPEDNLRCSGIKV